MGTPGHMAHPFDVDRVKTGQDLIDYINDAVLRLKNKEITGSVKWDGINTSFKLITNDEGKKEFRMDRGTSEIGSVIGFSAQSALKKWGTEHGMTQAIVKLLKIFDKALPLIEPELKELGMWDDPTKYFNTEYVTSAEEGPANVQEYEQNILAIHSINQFYEKKAQDWRIRAGTSMDRPGLERPIDPKTNKPAEGSGIEIPYNKDALASLIEKVQPIAAKAGFEIYGDVPVEFDPEGDLDIEKVLDTPIAIRVVPGGVETAPLREWLKGVVHPQDATVAKSDEWITEHGGKKIVGALSKDVYMAVLKSATDEGVPLSQYLESQEDVKDAINGGIFYHATRLLGQAVKNALTSKAGNLGKHEGVVLRGMEDFLVKLTGDFIVQGLASTHGDQSKQSLTEHPLQWAEGLTYTETLLVEARGEEPAVVYIPGGFKPPHRGHLSIVRQAAKRFPNSPIRVVSGRAGKTPKERETGREGITLEMARGVWEQYFKKDPELQGKDVDIIAITEPLVAVDTKGQPMRRAKDGEIITTYSPIEKIAQDAYRGETTPTIAVVYSKKDEQYGNMVRKVLKGLDEEGKLLTLAADVSGGPGNANLSSTALRQAIKKNDFETFKFFLPEFYDEEGARELFAMLGGTLEEISGMAVGSVAGTSGCTDCDDDEEKGLISEVVDYLLGITVG